LQVDQQLQYKCKHALYQACYPRGVPSNDLPHVLIADDEPNVAASLCTALGLRLRRKVVVEHCASGEDAAALIASKHYTLLITDQRMPGMTGLELLRRAHELNPSMLVILMTGYGTPEIEAAARRLGCPYLVKPFTVDKLVATVRGALRLEDG
jgi:DNA-binding NtrC family response regulator